MLAAQLSRLGGMTSLSTNLGFASYNVARAACRGIGCPEADRSGAHDLNAERSRGRRRDGKTVVGDDRPLVSWCPLINQKPHQREI